MHVYKNNLMSSFESKSNFDYRFLLIFLNMVYILEIRFSHLNSVALMSNEFNCPGIERQECDCSRSYYSSYYTMVFGATLFSKMVRYCWTVIKRFLDYPEDIDYLDMDPDSLLAENAIIVANATCGERKREYYCRLVEHAGYDFAYVVMLLKMS